RSDLLRREVPIGVVPLSIGNVFQVSAPHQVLEPVVQRVPVQVATLSSLGPGAHEGLEDEAVDSAVLTLGAVLVAETDKEVDRPRVRLHPATRAKNPAGLL